MNTNKIASALNIRVYLQTFKYAHSGVLSITACALAHSTLFENFTGAPGRLRAVVHLTRSFTVVVPRPRICSTCETGTV